MARIPISVQKIMRHLCLLHRQYDHTQIHRTFTKILLIILFNQKMVFIGAINHNSLLQNEKRLNSFLTKTKTFQSQWQRGLPPQMQRFQDFRSMYVVTMYQRALTFIQVPRRLLRRGGDSGGFSRIDQISLRDELQSVSTVPLENMQPGI